tara:strand:+ start:2233 stop:2649 length:417 start_codon:yes stop_codon:yes gene_type:complete
MSKYDLSKLDDLREFKTKCEYLVGNKKKVDLKAIRNARSMSQNSYLHVCISLFAIEFGYTLEESKTFLKRECSFMIYEKNNSLFLKKTSKMNSKELTEFIEWLRNYASENVLYIPSSEEYIENRFNIDQEIDKFKTYL